MVRLEVHRLEGVAERFFLRVLDFPRSLDPAERNLAERAARALRFGLEERRSDVVTLAEGIARELFLLSPMFGRSFNDGSGAGTLLTNQLVLEDLGTRITEELLRGRISVELEEMVSLTERREGPVARLPPLPPPKRERLDTFYDVRIVDEVGQAISGLAVEFVAGSDVRDLTTNGAGVVLAENVVGSTAVVAATDPEALETILDPRWVTKRSGAPKKEGNTTTVVFSGREVGPVAVKPAVPNTIVIQPPRGRLFVQLFDKTGRVRHAERDYTIEGPEPFAGTTDADGFLRHDEVFPGDYSLRLKLEFFEGADAVTDEYEAPLLALRAAEANQVRELGVVPFAVLARLHLFFNTNRAFLLPTALPALRKLRAIYAENNPSQLLAVGHADTTAGPGINDPLSLERAEATIAFLKDDVDAWLKFYDKPLGSKQRWGNAEDRMMLVSTQDFGTKPKGEDAVKWFQRTRGLSVDGKAGPITRRQLVAEYMALDGASLEDEGIQIDATAHGCGENFPLDDTGEALDAAPADDKRDLIDRRVEVFFFDPEFGILPKPPGPNSAPGSTQYPAWRKSVIQTIDLEPGDAEALRTTFIELDDVHFRTNSAVVLPEGETPTKDEATGAAITAVSVFAAVLRFNAEHPGRKLLVAGHTDTTADVTFNQALSNERAACALAVLVGDRAIFQKLCDARHTVGDIKQILKWASLALDDFDCDPGAIDDKAATAIEPIRSFQKAYNRNKAALGVPVGAADLGQDGAVGPLTWGAIFDCYEFALGQELGEDASGVNALRDKLGFVDPSRRSLGFSEYFPVEELGVDNFRSQANRRVEVLFFESGEEPDLAHAEDDPETSEVYLPGVYVRAALAVPVTGRRTRLRVRLLDADDVPIAATAWTIVHAAGTTEGVTLADGVIDATVAPDDGSVLLKVPLGEITLDVDDIPPADTIEGAQHRLNNLDYDVDAPPTTVLDQKTRAALTAYQTDHKLPVTGQLDPATSASLQATFGA